MVVLKLAAFLFTLTAREGERKVESGKGREGEVEGGKVTGKMERKGKGEWELRAGGTIYIKHFFYVVSQILYCYVP